MARATRSAPAPSEKDRPADPPPARKSGNKKRKRNSNTDNGDSPPSKHARTLSKDDGSPELDAQPEDKNDIELPSSGDVPIQSSDAINILEVLEMVDNQGLLDRVFPLPITSGEGASTEPSSSSSPMLSFRALLQNASQYPLSVLRAAVKHLYPISSHPRSRPSEPAAQQLRFCNLALSLLDQASKSNAPIPLHVPSLVGDDETQEADDLAPQSPASSGLRPHKYALVQHLPTGDWWSSASSTPPAVGGQEKDLKSLATAKAELVAIFPTPSDAEFTSKHTLGDYVTKKPPGAGHYKPPPPRRVSCGKFLYYGPYASFSPCFDQDGVEVGRVAMGEVIFDQEMKRRLRALAKGKRRAFMRATAGEGQTGDVDMEDTAGDGAVAESSAKAADLVKGLESLIPPEDVEAIKASLDTLEMEQAVDELLQRNARALQRLEELQLTRLRAQGSGSSVVEVGSEEWDVAQGIIDSLAVLASLRPRPSKGDSDQSPLVPPPSVLHKLQRTLPLDATEGWYGTLPEGRTTAFRDDTTVHLRAAASTAAKPAIAPATPSTPAKAPVTPAAAAAAAAAATTTTTAAPTTPYTPYTYQNTYQSSQYRGGYGTYAPTQTGSYYPNYAASSSATTTTAAAGGTTASSHYPNAQYGTAATAQGGYAYSPWYGYGNAQPQPGSGRATPQPGGATYTSYFAPGTPTQPQQQRAVANTAKPYVPPTYGATGGAYVPPTLPPHMRSAVAAAAASASAPGTPPPPPPPPASGGTYAAGYYGGYQAPR